MQIRLIDLFLFRDVLTTLIQEKFTGYELNCSFIWRLTLPEKLFYAHFWVNQIRFFLDNFLSNQFNYQIIDQIYTLTLLHQKTIYLNYSRMLQAKINTHYKFILNGGLTFRLKILCKVIEAYSNNKKKRNDLLRQVGNCTEHFGFITLRPFYLLRTSITSAHLISKLLVVAAVRLWLLIPHVYKRKTVRLQLQIKGDYLLKSYIKYLTNVKKIGCIHAEGFVRCFWIGLENIWNFKNPSKWCNQSFITHLQY